MKVYMIAGEASGDVLGALLMKSMTAENPATTFYGIGGPLMEREGLRSLFPMNELSLMGIVEVVPKIQAILKRIKETVANIRQLQPDVFISIDAPDFCFRVAKALHADGKPRPTMVHYVAPTVWAWRPGRAQKVAALYDGILCMFPFEPPYFLKHNLPSGYVGHPVMEQGFVDASGDAMRTQMGVPEGAQTLGLMFGSRMGEVTRHAEILRAIADKLQKDKPNLHFIVPTLPHLEEKLRGILDGVKNLHIIHNPDRKPEIFAAMDAAIAVSGTVALELSVANVPHVIAYKMSPLTWAIVTRAIKIRYAHLANILLNKRVVPEYIQDNCKPDAIAAALKGLLKDSYDVEEQRAEFATVRKLLHGKTKDLPSKQAAQFVLELHKQKTDKTFVPYTKAS